MATAQMGRLLGTALEFLGVHEVEGEAIAMLVDNLQHFTRHALRVALSTRQRQAGGGGSPHGGASGSPRGHGRESCLSMPELLAALRSDPVCVGLMEHAWMALPPPKEKGGGGGGGAMEEAKPSLEHLYAQAGLDPEDLPFRDFERRERVCEVDAVLVEDVIILHGHAHQRRVR